MQKDVTWLLRPLRLKSSWMNSSSTSQKNSFPFREQNQPIQAATSSSLPVASSEEELSVSDTSSS